MAYAGQLGFKSPDAENLRLIAEEVLANVIAYAYEEAPGDMEIRCRPGPNGLLHIDIIDTGSPFNFSAPEPDLESQISDRPVGGLGIYLVRTLAERVSYRREGRNNILEITVSRTNQTS